MATGLPFDPIGEAARQWQAHGWDDAAPGMAALTSVVRAQQLMLAQIDEVLRPLDLTFAGFELLTLLSFSRAGSLPLSRIGILLQVHPASVTNAVDRCESHGWVRRVRHADDRRTTLAELTGAGRDLAGSATVDLNERVFENLGLSARDLRLLFDVLARFRHRRGDF